MMGKPVFVAGVGSGVLLILSAGHWRRKSSRLGKLAATGGGVAFALAGLSWRLLSPDNPVSLSLWRWGLGWFFLLVILPLAAYYRDEIIS